MEIVGYKTTYSYIVKAGYQQLRYCEKFDSSEKGEEWLEYMKKKFSDCGGCSLWEVFKYVDPIYKQKEVKPLDLVFESEEERLKRERRRERV